MKGEGGKQTTFSMPVTLQEALRISEIIHRSVEKENKDKNKKCIHILSFRTDIKKCFNRVKRSCKFPQWKASPKENFASSAPRRQPTSRQPSGVGRTERGKL